MHTKRTRIRMFIAAMMVFVALGLAGVSQIGADGAGPALGLNFTKIEYRNIP
jgi:hypothetical protein